MHLSLRFSARYLYPRKYSRNWTLNPLQSPAYGTVCFFSPKFLVEITKIILFYIRIILINILPAFVRQCCRPLLSFYWYFTKYPLSLLTTQNSVEVTQKTYSAQGFYIPPLWCFEVLLQRTGILSDLCSIDITEVWLSTARWESVVQGEWYGWGEQQVGNSMTLQSSGCSRGSFFALNFAYIYQEERDAC